MATQTRTQTRTATGTRVGHPRTTGNPAGRPRLSPRTGKRVGRPKHDEDYDYGSKKKSRTTTTMKASRKQPPPDLADDDVHPAGELARAGGNDPVLARLVDVPDGNGGGGGGGSGGGSQSSQNSFQTGSGNDESHHSDADSIADEDNGNPVVVPFEVPGAPPVIIGRTPAEQRFSQFLAGPPFDCTDKARRVLYFQQFKSWDAVRDKVPEDLPKLFSIMTTKSFEVLHQETNTYVKPKAVGLATCWPSDPISRTPCFCTPSLAYPAYPTLRSCH